MNHLITLAGLVATSTLAAQCTVMDLDLDSLSVHWADGYVDAQGETWGVASVTDGSKDLLAVHLDAEGDVIWSRRYATVNPYAGLFPSKAVPSATGGMMIVGSRTVPTHENWFGLQVDAVGELEWARIYMEPVNDWDGYGSLPMVANTPTGGYQMTLPSGSGIQSLRLNADGTIAWHKRYVPLVGPVYGHEVTDVVVAPDGSTSYLCGIHHMESGADTTSAVILRADAQGDPLWSSWITGGEFRPRSACFAADGDLLIGGGYGSWATNLYGSGMLARLGNNGSLSWLYHYDAPGVIEAISELPSGELLLSPSLLSNYQGEDFAVIHHTSSNGTPIEALYSSAAVNITWVPGGNSFLDYHKEAMIGPGSAISYLWTVDDGNEGMKISRTHGATSADFNCGMTSGTLDGALVPDAASQPVPVDVEEDTARTWTMALVGYDQTVTELATYLYASMPPRPGFTYSLNGGIWNVGGTTSGPATVTLSYDPIAIYESSTPTATNVAGNVITWDVPAGFVGFEPSYFHASFSLPPDTALLGDQLSSTFSVVHDSAEYDPGNNTYTITQTVVGSYDPNDKLVWPQDFYHIENDSVLDYTIRFQNTGTFMAETVVIRDTLPLDLDVLSLRIGAASHPFTYSVDGTGILEIRFNDINLPDSNANEPLSHGMVGFRIKPILPLSLGQQITNAADIYFDFNPPIRTPDATVVVTDETGVHPAVKPEKFSVYPVPVKNTLTAVLPKGFEPVNALAIGVDGRRLPMFTRNIVAQQAEYRTEHLPPGAYVLTLRGQDGRRLSARFVKE